MLLQTFIITTLVTIVAFFTQDRLGMALKDSYHHNLELEKDAIRQLLMDSVSCKHMLEQRGFTSNNECGEGTRLKLWYLKSPRPEKPDRRGYYYIADRKLGSPSSIGAKWYANFVCDPKAESIKVSLALIDSKGNAVKDPLTARPLGFNSNRNIIFGGNSSHHLCRGYMGGLPRTRLYTMRIETLQYYTGQYDTAPKDHPRLLNMLDECDGAVGLYAKLVDHKFTPGDIGFNPNFKGDPCSIFPTGGAPGFCVKKREWLPNACRDSHNPNPQDADFSRFSDCKFYKPTEHFFDKGSCTRFCQKYSTGKYTVGHMLRCQRTVGNLLPIGTVNPDPHPNPRRGDQSQVTCYCL